MLGVVLISSLLPLIRNRDFYYWDDTAAVAVGVWQRIAEQVLSGHLPVLELDMWRGGNLVAEAATGMWNPVMLALMLITHPLDDVAAAITIAKILLLLVTSGGLYLLARGYSASRWAAALGGVMLPLSGWALFMDGTSWINGVAITAFTPWAWWAIRRCYLHSWTPGSVVIAVVAGYVLASVGNPYGMVALGAVFFAIAIEAVLSGRAREIGWLVGLGLGLLLLSVVVYLPFLLTSSVGFRADSTTFNTEVMSPNLSNLLGMSAPSYKPYIQEFEVDHLTFPGVYLAWFVLPALPWLRWRAPGAVWRPLAGVLGFGLLYLLVVLGPEQISMFRWPARLIPFLYLAVTVVFVVVLSRGWHRDRAGLRAGLSVVAVLAGAWMAYSDMPELWKWHALTSVVVVVLGAMFLRFGDRSGRGFTVLAGGSLLFLTAQLVISPSNLNVSVYNLPHSRTTMQQSFDDRYKGVTVQVGDFMALGDLKNPDGAWRDLLVGNMYSVAGVESTTAYTGIGYSALDGPLCITYNGATCPDAWETLWRTREGSTADLADLLRAETVVVIRDQVPGAEAPDGWTLSETTDIVDVYTRNAPFAYPDGRISSVGQDVAVSADQMVDAVNEVATVSTGDGSARSIDFARLAWPGYTATLDGRDVAVGAGSDGLLRVELPAGVTDGTLAIRFTPPGLTAGAVSAGMGGLLLVVMTALRSRSRSRSRSASAHR